MKKLLLIVFILSVIYSQGQNTSSEDYLNKVKTLDSTVSTLYAVISGEKGEDRDWDLFRYLFVEEAKLIPSSKTKEGEVKLNFLSIEGYLEYAGKYFVENGFFEKEIFRVAETYGSVTHIFSTYESYHSEKDDKPFTRGINSIQLMNDGNRWWIISVYWMGETEEYPIPKKYLPKK